MSKADVGRPRGVIVPVVAGALGLALGAAPLMPSAGGPSTWLALGETLATIFEPAGAATDMAPTAAAAPASDASLAPGARIYLAAFGSAPDVVVETQIREPNARDNADADAAKVESDTIGRWIFSMPVGRFEISTDDGRITVIEQDGRPIPAERYTFRQGRLVVKDAAGQTLLDVDLDAEPAPAPARAKRWAFESRRAVPGAPNAVGGDVVVRRAAPEGPAPRSMVGVTLVEPDEALLRHFELEPGSATMVSAVRKELPAAAAGLKPFDLVVAVDGRRGVTPESLRALIGAAAPGANVTLRVIQKGQERDVTLTLAPYDAKIIDDDNEANWLGMSRRIEEEVRQQMQRQFGGQARNEGFWVPEGAIEIESQRLRELLARRGAAALDDDRADEHHRAAMRELERHLADRANDLAGQLAPFNEGGLDDVRVGRSPRGTLVMRGANRADTDRARELEARLARIEALLAELARRQGIDPPPPIVVEPILTPATPTTPETPATPAGGSGEAPKPQVYWQ